MRYQKVSGGVTTHFVWDMTGGTPNLLKEIVGGTSNYYLYAGGVAVEQIVGSTAYFLHHDQLGSTRAVTDATGAVQSAYSYDAYGNFTNGSQGSVPLLYAGQYRDSESGLYYMRARYYDSVSGEFTSMDSLFGVTGSAYGYVEGNPVNAGDPNGLSDLSPTPKNCAKYGDHIPGCPLKPPPGDLCYRGPGGGDNGNGGCHTNLSTTQGLVDAGIAIGIGATIASGGALLGAEAFGLGASGLGWVSVAGGATAAGIDAGPCAHGDRLACVGVGTGLGTIGFGAFATLATIGSVAATIAGLMAFNWGFGALAADIANACLSRR